MLIMQILGVLVYSKLNTNPQYNLAAMMANCALGCIRKVTGSVRRDVIMLLC